MAKVQYGFGEISTLWEITRTVAGNPAGIPMSQYSIVSGQSEGQRWYNLIRIIREAIDNLGVSYELSYPLQDIRSGDSYGDKWEKLGAWMELLADNVGGGGPGGGGGDMLGSNNLSDVDNAGTSLTNLGGTTVGKALFTVANPGAITYTRINADNTVTLLSVADFRTGLGVGVADSPTLANLTLSGGTLTAPVNTNIELATSGTGIVTTPGIFRSVAGFSIGADAGRWRIDKSGPADGYEFSFLNNGDVLTGIRISGLLVGTSTDSSNGRLQLATHTTSAGGIGFGTDTSLFRIAGGQLVLLSGSGLEAELFFSQNGVLRSQFASAGVDYSISARTGSLILRSNNTTALTLDASQNATFAGNVAASGNIYAGSSSYILFANRTLISSPADGRFLLTDNAAGDFGRLQFGGTTSAFPSLKRSGTGLDVRLADDSAYTDLTGFNLYANRFRTISLGLAINDDGNYTLAMGSAWRATWSAGSSDSTADVGIGRTSDGLLQINNGTLGTLRSLSLLNLTATGVVVFADFTVGTVPSAATYPRGNIFVNNETGGATPAFSDGVSWRRYSDRAVIS